MKHGTVLEKTICFTNTGKEDLKIEFVQGGCTCTEPLDYPRKAIKPGQKGCIKFKFDSGLADVKKGYSSSLEIYGNVKDDVLLYYLTADIVE